MAIAIPFILNFMSLHISVLMQMLDIGIHLIDIYAPLTHTHTHTPHYILHQYYYYMLYLVHTRAFHLFIHLSYAYNLLVSL